MICTLSLFAFFDHALCLYDIVHHTCVHKCALIRRMRAIINLEHTVATTYIVIIIYNIIDVDNLGCSLLIVSNTNSYTFTKQLWCMLHSRT